jgi:hypothetical protein
MPYITPNYRKELEPLIDALSQKINEIHKLNPNQTRDGLMNFSLTEIIHQVFPNPRYTDMNEIIGFLECCKLEYYRKTASPYEDKKESENGPVRKFDTNGPTSY